MKSPRIDTESNQGTWRKGYPMSDDKVQAHRFARVNAGLVTTMLSLHLFALLIVPLILLQFSPWWGIALLPVAAVSNPLWSIVHEAIHGHLFGTQRANDGAGRVLGILHGAPFRALRIGHLVHHRYSRTERERAEVYEPERTARAAAVLRHYARLLDGTYFLQVFGVLLSYLPMPHLAVIGRRLDQEDSVAG
jgi:fatty acid desaturase